MFFTFPVLATFGVSALVSFAISTSLLLMVVAKQGYLRVGGQSQPQGGQVLLPPKQPTPIIAEMTPLKQKM